MADCDIFREQIAIKYPSFGHALWEPSPTNPNRPVQIGDVGFIRQGRFYRLFSALLPADDPSQELGVPEYHEPLVPTLSDHVATVFLDPDYYCSAGVEVEVDPGYRSSPDGFPQVLFQCKTTQGGAILSLPVTARRENTLMQNDFKGWLVKHIDAWFAFARNLGLGIERMEEIILVTGCDLTRSWTNIAFLKRDADEQESFGVRVEDPNTSVNSQISPNVVLRHGPEGMNLPENQCVFIRGFRVARSFWILPKRLKAASGPSPDSGGYNCDSDVEGISIPTITQFRDPLHLLSDYIAQQASDCDKILVHDNDLLMVDGIGHNTLLETLEPDVMVDLLQKSNIMIYKSGCDSFLSESQRGPNTDTSYVKVASLSMIFQNRNTTPPSQWPPPHYYKSAGGHGQDVNSTGAPLIAYSIATPRGPSFDPSSNLVDHVVGSTFHSYQQDSPAIPRQIPSGNYASLQVSAMKRPANDTDNLYRYPVCPAAYRRPQERKWHILLPLPHWLQCPNGRCSWRGCRWIDLLTHHRKYHSSSSLEVDRNKSKIYDRWPLVEGIVKDETTLQNAMQQAMSLLKGRAVEVRKLEPWEGNFWGRKEEGSKSAWSR